MGITLNQFGSLKVRIQNQTLVADHDESQPSALIKSTLISVTITLASVIRTRRTVTPLVYADAVDSEGKRRHHGLTVD